MARATGAEVWVPKIEAFVLADINSFVPWPGFGPFESYEAEHTLEGGERLELAGFEIDVLFTPGHSPGHVTFSIPDEQAIFSGDVLFQGSVGRTDLPGGDRHAAGVDPHAGRVAPGRDRRLSRPHGHHHPRRRAGHQPVPRRAREVSRKLQAPRGTFDVLPADARRRLRLVRDRRRRARARGLRADRDAGVRGHRAVRARGGGVHRHRPEGDVHLRGQGRPLADAAARGHRRRLPRLRRARHAQAAAAGEGLVPRARSSATRRRRPGRFRQFTQIDAEALGSDDPTLDAELILLLAEIYERAGAGPSRLRLSSLGTPETRADYLDELRGYLRAREGELSEEVRGRLEQNPLRAFDADHPGTQAVMADAPRLLDRLTADDAEHFAEVRALLDGAGLPYEIDPTLVRGLDYYTRTVFEFESERLGAQAALGGGGRYDGLVEELGGPPTPGVGWAAGVERILLAAGDGRTGPRHADVFVAVPDGRHDAFVLVAAAPRAAACAREMEQAGRSLKGQLKQADRIGARAGP